MRTATLLLSLFLALCFAAPLQANGGKLVHVVRFTDYDAGSIEDWLQGKGFKFEQDAQKRNYVDLDVDDRGLEDPLAAFLFERRSGHCEYFASAMTVLLRVNEVPARLVTGFQPGNYSNLTGTWSVRARDGHAWVEAWIPDRGWVAYDPTPADAASARLGPIAWMRELLDVAVTYWDDNVIGYNVYFQINALLTLRDGLQAAAERVRANAGTAWAVLGGLALLAGALWLQLRMLRARRKRSRTRVAWMERVLRRLERRS